MASPGSRIVHHPHVEIPLPDGTRLSASIWLPDDADSHPVPAVLEYLPYRKGDWTAGRDAERHPWFAQHGYAGVRVDIRGSGDSTGVMADEYSEEEIDDACHVIAWLAEQPWCAGSVGMFGISWGGFNALQVAAKRPPALRTIVTVCSSDDRFATDVHYFGGSVLGSDMLGWSTTMLAFTARPPDPSRVGSDWRDMWRERLDGLDPFVHTWLAHQTPDAYWRRGSVCTDYSAIDIPVLAVGGWSDPYRDTVLRLLDGLPARTKGLIGPWAHQYPDRATRPGPAIGFLQEMRRWWDRWLRDEPNGAEGLPALRAWIHDPVPPATTYDDVPGRWVGLQDWPSSRITTTVRPLGHQARLTVHAPQQTGMDAGRYFPFGNVADLPPDQRADDGRSVCFDHEVTEPTTVLGNVVAALALDDPRGTVIVRLCDVAPDGASTLVTRGAVNLAQEGAVDDEGRVRVSLVAAGWSFEPGHRMRISVSQAYWPWIWPHAEDAALQVKPLASRVELPVLEGTDSIPTFEAPEQAPRLPIEHPPAPDTPERVVCFRPDTGEWRLTIDPAYGGSGDFPDGLVYREQAQEEFHIREHDPLSARATSQWRLSLTRDEWAVDVDVSASMSATAEHFVLDHEVVCREGSEVFHERTWHREIPRTAG